MPPESGRINWSELEQNKLLECQDMLVLRESVEFLPKDKVKRNLHTYILGEAKRHTLPGVHTGVGTIIREQPPDKRFSGY